MAAWVVDSNVLVACVVVALHRFVVLHLGLAVAPSADLVIGGATLALYGVDRLFDRVVEGERRATRAPLVVGASAAIGVVLALIGLASSSVAVRVLVGVGAAASLTYGLPIRRRAGVRRWARLKDLPGVKSWMVAAAVSVAVVSVPVVASGARWGVGVVVTVAMVFSLTAANAHLFDLRDVEWDRRLEVPSVPVVWGVTWARRLVIGLLLAGTLLAIVDALLGTGPSAAGVAVAGLVVLPLAIRGGPQTPRLVWPLVVDGALVLPLVVAWIAG